MPESARVDLMGLGFDRVDMARAVDRCLHWCASRVPHTVVTANAAILCTMRRDSELAAACRAGDLNLADGMSTVWALGAAGTPVPERVAGVDLMARLLEEGGKRGFCAFFLGAHEETVARLAEECRVRYPGLVVAGYRNGYFGPDDHEAIVEEIRRSGAHMLFVGMPSPFKEVFCERYRWRLGVPIIMGVGGSFDVLAGKIPRAPVWMRQAGLEWFWRLLTEPRKMWRRYLATNTQFLFFAGSEALKRRFAAARLPPPAGEAGP